jgi:hypothetical protein
VGRKLEARKSHFGNAGVDRNTILRWILERKRVSGCGTDSNIPNADAVHHNILTVIFRL